MKWLALALLGLFCAASAFGATFVVTKEADDDGPCTFDLRERDGIARCDIGAFEAHAVSLLEVPALRPLGLLILVLSLAVSVVIVLNRRRFGRGLRRCR